MAAGESLVVDPLAALASLVGLLQRAPSDGPSEAWIHKALWRMMVEAEGARGDSAVDVASTLGKAATASTNEDETGEDEAEEEYVEGGLGAAEDGWAKDLVDRIGAWIRGVQREAKTALHPNRIGDLAITLVSLQGGIAKDLNPTSVSMGSFLTTSILSMLNAVLVHELQGDEITLDERAARKHYFRSKVDEHGDATIKEFLPKLEPYGTFLNNLNKVKQPKSPAGSSAPTDLGPWLWEVAPTFMFVLTCPLVHGVIEPSWRRRIWEALSSDPDGVNKPMSLDIVDGEPVDLGLVLHAIPVAAGVGDKEKKAWDQIAATTVDYKGTDPALVAILRGSYFGVADDRPERSTENQDATPLMLALPTSIEAHANNENFGPTFTKWLNSRRPLLSISDKEALCYDGGSEAVRRRRIATFEALRQSTNVIQAIEDLQQTKPNTYKHHILPLLDLFVRETGGAA